MVVTDGKLQTSRAGGGLGTGRRGQIMRNGEQVKVHSGTRSFLMKFQICPVMRIPASHVESKKTRMGRRKVRRKKSGVHWQTLRRIRERVAMSRCGIEAEMRVYSPNYLPCLLIR